MSYKRSQYTYFKSLLLLAYLFVSSYAISEIPAGYYSSATGSGATLKTQLYNIISSHTQRSYDNLWTDFQTTDAKPDGKVWDIYTDIPGGTPVYTFTFSTNQCGTYAVEGDCYNREHSFPKSWFGGEVAPMYTDLFHLYPTDGKVNGMRGNFPIGEVNGAASYTSSNGSKVGPCTYPGYTGNVFEPIDDFKGDLARSYFYMATCYENVIAGWENNDTNGAAVMNGTSYPVFETWFLNMLYQWHVADPVSQKEIDRNNAIYGIQGNRNPYIDHPEYVATVWGFSSGATPEPTNHATGFNGRNIRLRWTDATGTSVPDGYLIRMSTTSFNAITAPTDGTSYADSATDRNIAAGIQEVTFTNLNAGTYYFKIYPYKGSGASIDFKTDGSVPQYSKLIQ